MNKLYRHQEEWLSKNKNKRKVALWWSTGLGKSAAACHWMKSFKNPLVVCPKGLVLNWKKELSLWDVRAAVMSKEDFKKYTAPHDALVIDEADWFASPHFKSKLSKHLRAYLTTHNPALLLATATCYRSSPWNIYTLSWYLGRAPSWHWFNDTFFTQVWMGRRQVPQVKHSAAPLLRSFIAEIGDVRVLEDCVDVPEQIDETVRIQETKEQKEEKKAIQEVVPIARFTAEHRIESRGDKFDVIARLCEENPKIAVVCRYRDQIEQLISYLSKSGKPVYAIHGDVSTQERERIVENVRTVRECIVLIQSATCEGYSLETIPVMVFASLDFSFRNWKQMRGRIQRINNIKRNVYITLICGDADKAVFDAIMRGRDFDVTSYYKNKTT